MRLNLTAFFGAALCAAMSLPAFAADEKTDLKVGDKAPKFQAKDDQGETWKSEDHVGKKILVVYFYPADFTGGCTKQACGFRDDMKKLESQDVEVIGVSGDTPETHAAFKKHHNLNFTLLADEDGSVAKKFGVPTRPGGTVSIPGSDKKATRGVTTARWTFVIDKDGEIALKNTQVNAAEDSQAILEAVEELKKS